MSDKIKIVIADDHPIFRCGLCDVLRQDDSLELAGEAANGQEAIELIAELHPSVIVLDVHMPRLSGMQTARRVREEFPGTKIILLTMHEDPDMLMEALDLGVHAYVLKDDAVGDLLRAVHAILSGKTFVSSAMTSHLVRHRQESNLLRGEKPQIDMLTPMERQVLKLVANDMTTKEIAQNLGKAIRTVETHRQNISQKLGLKGSHSLLKFAFQNKARL